MTSRRISTSSFHKAYAQNVHWPSPAYHVYTLRMNTAGLSRSGLNRAMRSARVLHTVHATTWGGSRSARPPTPHQCFPPGTQLFRMHPCSFSPIHSSVSLLLQLPRPLPLLVLTVIFRYPLPSPPLLIYLLGEMKTLSNCYWWLCNTDKSCHPF